MIVTNKKTSRQHTLPEGPYISFIIGGVYPPLLANLLIDNELHIAIQLLLENLAVFHFQI